jgi:hypothetical protein
MMNPGHRSCTASASKAFHVADRGTQLDILLCGQVVALVAHQMVMQARNWSLCAVVCVLQTLVKVRHIKGKSRMRVCVLLVDCYVVT